MAADTREEAGGCLAAVEGRGGLGALQSHLEEGEQGRVSGMQMPAALRAERVGRGVGGLGSVDGEVFSLCLKAWLCPVLPPPLWFPGAGF